MKRKFRKLKILTMNRSRKFKKRIANYQNSNYLSPQVLKSLIKLKSYTKRRNNHTKYLSKKLNSFNQLYKIFKMIRQNGKPSKKN